GIIDIGEELRADKSTEKGSNDTEEIVNVLSSMEAANILSNGGAAFSTASVSLLMFFQLLVFLLIPIISLKDKGKEKVTETKVPKKKKLQEQIDAQVAREMEEEFARKKSKVKSNEVIVKHLSEYEQAEADLSVREKIELVRKREYWKIIRLGGHIRAYQFFIDMLNQFDREDLHQLWILVKETFSIKQAPKDKEKELWVELKRLFEPDPEDQLWTYHQAFMHDPLDWKLYDTCGVQHVSTKKNQEIFMLVEKDYPLRKGLAIVMISNKLQVEQYLQMASDLLLKTYNIANNPR
nr:hypothetical protein [Tanacetum cinerariifolium]